MMYYAYDDYGFYIESQTELSDRATTVAPPDDPLKQWNWNGVNWVGLPLDYPHPKDAPTPIISGPTVPAFVTMRQARLALLGAGLLDTVNSAVASMPGEAGIAARIEWEYSGDVFRHKALVVGLTAALGLSEAQVDALFITAATIA